MKYDDAFVERFLAEFAASPPRVQQRKAGANKRMLVATARARIEHWRREGHTLEAIAQRFSDLGVPMSTNTLRTCLRRSESPKTVRRRPRAPGTSRNSAPVPTPHAAEVPPTAATPEVLAPGDHAVSPVSLSAPRPEMPGSRKRTAPAEIEAAATAGAKKDDARGLPNDARMTPAASPPSSAGATTLAMGTGWVPRNR